MVQKQMLPKSIILLSALWIAATVLPIGSVIAQTQAGTVNFAKDIRPILENHCVRCHGPDEPEGGYRMDNRDEAMVAIETGDSESSDFYLFLTSEEEDVMMPPPDEGGPLRESDIQLVKTWINEGANWPDGMELKEAEGSRKADGTEVSAATQNDDRTPDPDDTSSQRIAAPEVVDVVEKPAAENAPREQPQPNIWRAIGSLHPAATHLPLGLLMAAGLFALFSLRGNFVMSDCAYYCLWLGTLGAIVACLTGWWFTMIEHPKEMIGSIQELTNMEHKVFWHRTSALIVTVFALLLVLFAASARNRDPDEGVAWKLGLIVLAIGIGFVGHQGGKLTWKAGHYRDLEGVIREYIPGLFGKEADAGKPADDNVQQPAASSDGDADNEDASGETSGESTEDAGESNADQ